MSNLTEADLYNLMGRSGVGSDQMQNAIIRMMAMHLYRDHCLGVHEIAKSLGIKRKEAALIICKEFAQEKKKKHQKELV